jgi:hypothetical protein
MYTLKEMEYLSLKQCSTAASLDWATQSSASQDKYVSENSVAYYAAINTWLALWDEYADYAWIRLADLIMSEGLISAINTMQTEALRILQSEPIGPWGRMLMACVDLPKPVFRGDLDDTMITRDVTTCVLTLLRYPKRFSPVGNDIIQEQTLSDFLKYEKRTKRLQRHEYYGEYWAKEHVKRVISEMYPWDTIVSEIDALELTDLRFSAGAARDARPNLGDKVSAIVKDGRMNDFILPIMGVYTLPRPAYIKDPKRVSKIVAVPKSYKSSRIIAMESTYPIAMGKAIEYIFRRHDNIITLEDQTRNQKGAQIGSIDGSIATIDASHASDLISKSLFMDLFPREYTRRVYPLLPQYCEVKGVTRPLQMASTSGHTLTFRHETIIYYAIAKAALDICSSLGIEIHRPYALAYGDDTLISAEAYDIALYLFSRLGLVINTDKSYNTGNYRESCGEDYIDGVPVTSIYFPRFPVLGKLSEKDGRYTVRLDQERTFNDEYRGKLDNSVTMLIDLQKKVFPICRRGAEFLRLLVNAAFPSITTSVAGEECNDMWDYMDSGKIYYPSAFERVIKDTHYRYPRVYEHTRLGYAHDFITGDGKSTFVRAEQLDTLHRYPSVSFQDTGNFSEEQVLIFEYWSYVSFLQHGPKYEDPLLELLGITQRPMSISEFYGKRKLIIKTHR